MLFIKVTFMNDKKCQKSNMFIKGDNDIYLVLFMKTSQCE